MQDLVNKNSVIAVGPMEKSSPKNKSTRLKIDKTATIGEGNTIDYDYSNNNISLSPRQPLDNS